MIKTRIIVERKRGDGKRDRKVYALPTENDQGFHGTAEITMRAGQAVSVAIPRETLGEDTAGGDL